MILTSLKTIRALLLKNNAKPSKIMGQNFLIDPKTLNRIVKTAQLSLNDTVLEVGPGIGTLTQELAKEVKRVVAIEKDRTMVQILKETLKDFKNVEIIRGDALKESIYPQINGYKVVSNIPYYLTSPLIRNFLESKKQPDEMIIMVQKEVAKRICSKPPKMNLLALSAQFYARVEIIFYVSKNCFWPSPKVDSAVIKITPHKIKEDPAFVNLFFKIAKAGFSHPRKQLVNNLSVLKLSDGVELDKVKTAEWLLKNNINPGRRAETLSLDDWKKLASSVNSPIAVF